MCIAAIVGRLRDAAPDAREGKKIDFIFASGRIDVINSCAVKNPLTAVASDHLPWIADVRVKPAPDVPADKGVYDNDDERVTDAIGDGK